MSDVALLVPIDVERGGLVGPLDLVEIQQLGELPFGVMGEVDLVMGKQGPRGRLSYVLAFGYV